MEMLKLPEGMKYKIIVDDFQAFHNAHQGLLAEDYMRIGKDLEKISKLPLFIYDNKKNIKLGTSNNKHSEILPLRKVQIICNTEYGSGRLTGYLIKDNICMISDYSGKKVNLKREIKNWYKDATRVSGSGPFEIGQKKLSIKELEEFVID